MLIAMCHVSSSLPMSSSDVQGGVLTRSKDICHIPCKNPVIIPGQCCPVCQGKWVIATVYCIKLKQNRSLGICKSAPKTIESLARPRKYIIDNWQLAARFVPDLQVGFMFPLQFHKVQGNLSMNSITIIILRVTILLPNYIQTQFNDAIGHQSSNP